MRFDRQERLFWVLLYHCWQGCLQTLRIFQPNTLVRWHRNGFRYYWRRKSCRGKDGRPAIDKELRELIRTMSRDNVGWGSPRIHGEILRHDHREVAHFNVNLNPTAQWTAQQNPYVERLIGSIRRECSNHVIVLNEGHLRGLLKAYFAYYHEARTHLSLSKQCRRLRTIELTGKGQIDALPHIGGLHHEFRRAA